MAYYARKRPIEILQATARYEKGLFRVEHLSERKVDQQEALSELRKSKRLAQRGQPAKATKSRSYQDRVRM
jgi:translation initiation factor 1 (eIF-1/SUI1)